jgi:3-hydroxyisobutyrate dehydrogenase-like beta-hydroxyacid dehydrogenase
VKVAYIGLGTMGGAMAGHIQAAGIPLRVFNRSEDRAARWVQQHGGVCAATLAEAVSGADIVFTCLSDDSAMAEVLSGPDGLLTLMIPGSVLADHGSGSPQAARALAEKARSRGVDFFDAPVTGGSKAAREGTLTVMAGAEAALLARAEPAMRCYASEIISMGDVGAGHLTKLVNVVIGQGTGFAVAEGLGFAMAAGLDPAKVVDVLSRGSSQSWLLDNRSAAMIGRDFQPHYPLTMARKDLGNALDQARDCGAPLPLTALAAQIVASLVLQQGGGEDLASLIRFFRPDAGS